MTVTKLEFIERANPPLSIQSPKRQLRPRDLVVVRRIDDTATTICWPRDELAFRSTSVPATLGGSARPLGGRHRKGASHRIARADQSDFRYSTMSAFCEAVRFSRNNLS